jgi:hypothetical protein
MSRRDYGSYEDEPWSKKSAHRYGALYGDYKPYTRASSQYRARMSRGFDSVCFCLSRERRISEMIWGQMAFVAQKIF